MINSCTDLFLTNYTRKNEIVKDKKSVFSVEGGVFWPSFTVCVIIIGVILICGLVFEYYRAYGWKLPYCKNEESFVRQNTVIEDIVTLAKTVSRRLPDQNVDGSICI